MSKKTIFYVLFFTGLVISFYLVIINITDIGKESLPPLNTVRPFSFVRQDGKEITEKDISGKPI
jgi:cytochrome oxidase Cu insertion factor (SCO1/SenC/PrrC family)